MAKVLVENCEVLDVVKLAREGGLVEGYRGKCTWSRAGKEIAVLSFQVKDDCLRPLRLQTGYGTNEHPPPVKLTRTRTSFGAERMGFLCPLCGSRVRKLYLPPRGSQFGCRSCHALAYASQRRRSDRERAMALDRWLEKLERRLGLSLMKEDGEGLTAAATAARPPRDRFPPDPHPAPAEGRAPEKRPRGRPKEKRPYQRRTPFLSGERPSESHGLCMRCRDFRELGRPRPVTLANGRSALKGTCPLCGATMMLIVKG